MIKCAMLQIWRGWDEHRLVLPRHSYLRSTSSHSPHLTSLHAGMHEHVINVSFFLSMFCEASCEAPRCGTTLRILPIGHALCMKRLSVDPPPSGS